MGTSLGNIKVFLKDDDVVNFHAEIANEGVDLTIKKGEESVTLNISDIMDFENILNFLESIETYITM
tara:strand:- start:24690 stop:24890 length:201 start_codon:yes stop_codon:yes gene_type:complete